MRPKKLKRVNKKRPRGRCLICGFTCRLFQKNRLAARHWVYHGKDGVPCPGSGSKFWTTSSVSRGEALAQDSDDLERLRRQLRNSRF